MMCGKTTKDFHSEEHGWDESCVLNCVLVDEATKRPTEAQVQEFAQEHKRQLGAIKSDIATLLHKLRNGITSDIDPETLALAQEAADAVERRSSTGRVREK